MGLNLHSIPSGAPFLDSLARGLIARHGRDGLPDVTVLVPNRRAARALTESFLRVVDGAMVLLPAIRPIGDVDEDALILDPGPDPLGADLDIPPAIPALERQLLLARLIKAKEGEEQGLGTALQLAEALASLIDEVAIARRDFAGLADLAPERFAAHWQRVLDFLGLVTTHWPAILAERGLIDPADRRGRLIEALARRLTASPPTKPIYVAGSTGSIPATADLMAVVARADKGAVVLPGLDRDLDADSWAQIEAGHPQWGMKHLLAALGAERADVRPWDAVDEPRANRARLLSEALRPAATTDRWREAGARLGADPSSLVQGLSRVVAQNEVEEAALIALALRRALETPGRTAALVTPDRALARRVAANLARWGIDIDDSAGQPLATLPLGTFLRLIMDVVADPGAPAPLLALVKHALTGLGRDRATLRREVAALEIGQFRGPRPPGDLNDLAARLAPDHQARGLAEALARALGPVLDLARGEAPLDRWVEAHARAAEALADDPQRPGPLRLWVGEAGDSALALFSEVLGAGDAIGAIGPADYSALITTLMTQATVRPTHGKHPRLAIWGPIEARLQQADLMILGGLNEETWPPAESVDPWFSRPMRAQFGLDPPERRLGQSAHDFVMAAAAPEAILTRSAKVGGAPTVASRWLLRLETVLDGLEPRPGERRSQVLDGENGLLALAAALDAPGKVRPVAPPAPRPPVTARPRALSVTEIETLIRDPYAIYARRILKLRPLNDIDADPDAAMRGTVVHAILEAVTRRLMGTAFDPETYRAAFVEIAAEIAAPLLRRPGLAALWWPRLRRIADRMATTEGTLRNEGATVVIEGDGALVFDAPAGPFTLRARADRIDRRPEGLVIIDYKTGEAPTVPTVLSGLSPQLPLEGAIARQGGFPGIAPAPVAGLEVLRLSGGTPPIDHRRLDLDAEAVSVMSLHNLQGLIAQFDAAETPYRSRPRPQFESRFGDYDHLARVREWSTAGGEE